jgi:hypothetical protein
MSVKALVRLRDGNKCVYCGLTDVEHRQRYGKDLHVHRIVPGSVYTLEGCETVCQPCHKQLPKRAYGERVRQEGIIVVRLPDPAMSVLRHLAKIEERTMTGVVLRALRPTRRMPISSGSVTPTNEPSAAPCSSPRNDSVPPA